MKLISDGAEIFRSVVGLLRGGPFFLSRIGGSDTNSVALYLYLQSRGESLDCYEMRNKKNLAERYNGYYDRDGLPQNYIRYCKLLLDAYKASNHLLFCNYQLLSMYFPETLSKDQVFPEISNRNELRTLIDDIDRGTRQVSAYPYGFIENLLLTKLTLFRVFETELSGKTVLVVSPLSKSIESNFENRHEFFYNYKYPDFTLQTLNTPITYSGLPAEFYPHANWFETLDALRSSISEKEFDIALLSCGSYAMPLGLHVEGVLGRQAIYVGGLLQLYFGIMGRRYTGPFVQQQTNPDAFIWPIEREDYMPHVSLKENAPTEGFGAYF
jgi:hypothetical protein